MQETKTMTTETETKAAVGGKVRVLGENLRAALATVKGAVARRATLPVTMNVLIQTDKSRLVLTTTDLEKAITTTIGAQVDEPLAITVPYRMLVDVVKGLPDDVLELTVKGDGGADQTLVIQPKGGGTMRIAGTAPDEFPPVPVIEDGIGLFCDLPEFLAAIGRVIDCAATDDSRPVLTGVYFDVKETLNGHAMFKIATADGFRLGVDAVSGKFMPIDKTTGFIVPAATIRALATAAKRVEGELAIVVKGSQAKLVTGRFEIVTQLIQGNFPDYTKLIPTQRNTIRVVNRELFAEAVKGVAPYARDGSGIVRLLIGGDSIAVTAKAEEMGEATREIACITVKGGKAKIAFDCRFLSDVLALRLETIELGVSEHSAPGVFKSPDAPTWVHVLMPMAVQW